MQKIGKKILSLLKISRFFISSIAGLVSLCTYINTSNIINIEESIYLFITVTFTSAFGFCINDYFDREKDLLNHFDRMLPSKTLGLNVVIMVSIFLFVVSAASSYILGFTPFILNLLIIILLFTYSFVNNKYGFFANIITALISSFTIIYGMVVGEFKLFLLIVSVASFFLILGREILLDIRDRLADSIINKSSIPVKYGNKNAIKITSLFFLLYTILIVLATLINNNSISFLIFVTIISNMLIWYSFLKYFKSTTMSNLNQFFLISRLSFLLLVISLIL